jgi:hypothetical protein
LVPPIERVSKRELCDLFNTEYLPLIREGKLLTIVESEGMPNPRNRQPAGTRSQRVSFYRNTGRGLEKVATCHQYVLPDGSLGASGKPDPKMVFHDGTVFAAGSTSSS